MKAVVAAFNQEKALVGAFSVITNLRMELFEALVRTVTAISSGSMQEAFVSSPKSLHNNVAISAGGAQQ